MTPPPRTPILTLRDGSRVHVRPIDPADRDVLERGFERLGPESRYRRFFSPVNRLSAQQLDYLTRIDHHDHEALLAIDEQSGEGVAVARFVRVGDGLAEPAIAVVDHWQGRGLAGPLLELLARRAREEGVRRFAAPILAENAAAVAVFQRLGPTSKTQSGREIELLIDLPPRGRPLSPRRLFESAAGTLAPVLAFAQRLLPRRGPADVPRRNAIVVGCGLGGPPATGVEQAAGLARATKASVHIVAASRPLLDDHSELESRASTTAGHLRRNGLRVEIHVRRGDVATVLLETAVNERARLIVVDEAVSPGAEGWLLGSVWDHVSHHAPCNVLIARSEGG